MDLFDSQNTPAHREPIGHGAWILRARAQALDDDLLAGIELVTKNAPLRRMITPGGFMMSVSMTNSGELGWVTDRSGYRYESTDPQTGKSWPPLPESFPALAREAAAEAGYDGFTPDACLINRYEPGARLSLHQDRNETDFANPIVSVSLGLPASFQFGGAKRSDPVQKHQLRHGDVVVWGERTRLNFHGVLPLKDGVHEKLGRARINLTFRRAA